MFGIIIMYQHVLADASDSNYYSSDPAEVWETMTDFLREFENADIDMNLVYRWDIRKREDCKLEEYYAEVFIIKQRKGIYSPHHITNINEKEAIRFEKYLIKHWQTMQKLWKPINCK